MEESAREFKVNVRFGGSKFGTYRYRGARMPEVGAEIEVENLSGNVVRVRVTQITPPGTEPRVHAEALNEPD